MFPYLVCEFGKGTLSNLVKECFGTDFPDIIKKKQVNYIYNYLNDLEAKSVLLEAEYVDKDYLEDYSRYYVKCFTRYGERCARLHFFKEKITHSDFDSIFEDIDSSNKDKITDSYLGFVVVKPIPKTFIGKTCLKVYESFFNEESSKALITQKYTVGLFGLKLHVDTVAFQEQDKVLSACATTAIWSALHGLKKNNIRDIPSSGEITLAAINHINNSSNSFPNDGLTNKQILRALDVERLRHHLINIETYDESNKDRIFEIIKIYIDSKVPIILGADIYEKQKYENESNEDNQEYIINRLDGHAVTVLGYQDLDNEKVLYLHDDRIGPFARARIGRIKDFVPNIKSGAEKLDWCIALQEKNDDGEWLAVDQILIPDSLIIPTNKKVRIPAEYISNTCCSIIDEYELYIDSFKEAGEDVSNLQSCLTCRVTLEELSGIRERVFNDERVINKRDVLTKSTARFLWSAKFCFKSELAFELLFDATDIPQGNIVSNIIIYDEVNFEASIGYFKGLINSGHPLPESKELNFLGAFISFLKPKEKDLFDYLDNEYGELRAPLYLKEAELADDQLQEQKNIKKHYGKIDHYLEDDFAHVHDDNDIHMIWVISHDGALLIGEEEGNKGHPTLTGFKMARIAGELRRDTDGWYINSKSGRYSSDYENANDLLHNVKNKFYEVYSCDDSDFRVKEYNEEDKGCNT